MKLRKDDLLLLGLAMATGSEVFTSDAVNLVLPDMAGTLGLSQDEASWIVTTYNAAMFLGVPLAVWLGDAIGHRRLLIWGVVAYAIAAIGGCSSSTLSTMLIWRALQGLVGSSLFMWWRATIYMIIPGPQRSASLMKVSTCLYAATALGLLFSGYVTDEFSWRLMFVPNVVLGLGAVAILSTHYPDVPEREGERAPPADRLGIALLGIAVVCLQIFLSRGQIEDWLGTTHMQVLAWSAGIGLGLFVIWQGAERNKHPLVSLELLTNRNIVAAASIGVGAGIILSSVGYALPKYLRTVDPQPHSATHTGLVMSAYPLAAMVLRPLTTKLIGRFGQRKGVAAAMLAVIASTLLIARLMTTGTPDIYYVPSLVLYATCLCFMLPSIGGGTVSKIPAARQLDGVTIYMSFRQFGTSFGVTLVSLLLARRETLHSSRLYESLRTDRPVVETWLQTTAHSVVARGGDSLAHARDMALKLLQATSEQQVSTLAYADCFLALALIGAVTLCLVALMAPLQPK